MDRMKVVLVLVSTALAVGCTGAFTEPFYSTAQTRAHVGGEAESSVASSQAEIETVTAEIQALDAEIRTLSAEIQAMEAQVVPLEAEAQAARAAELAARTGALEARRETREERMRREAELREQAALAQRARELVTDLARVEAGCFERHVDAVEANAAAHRGDSITRAVIGSVTGGLGAAGTSISTAFAEDEGNTERDFGLGFGIATAIVTATGGTLAAVLAPNEGVANAAAARVTRYRGALEDAQEKLATLGQALRDGRVTAQVVTDAEIARDRARAACGS